GRQRDEGGPDARLDEGIRAARGQHVEPRVADEQRPGNGCRDLGERGAARDQDRGARERKRESDVESTPCEPPVVGVVVRWERPEQVAGPGDEQHDAKAESRCYPRWHEPAPAASSQCGARAQLKSTPLGHSWTEWSSVAPVALLAPGVAVVVVAVRLPEARLVGRLQP